jgi:hypothetical protein
MIEPAKQPIITGLLIAKGSPANTATLNPTTACVIGSIKQLPPEFSLHKLYHKISPFLFVIFVL